MAHTGNPVFVFANGVLADIGWLPPILARAAAVIAADGGLRHVLALGRRPDVLIGDLDSLPPGVDPETAAGKVIRYPRDKDETDLELALLYAVDHYPDAEVFVVGGAGGRLDHLLANVLLLAHPLVPVVPVLGMATCLGMMAGLDKATWLNFFAWLAIGLVIYFSYGKRHSVLAKSPT